MKISSAECPGRRSADRQRAQPEVELQVCDGEASAGRGLKVSFAESRGRPIAVGKELSRSGLHRVCGGGSHPQARGLKVSSAASPGRPIAVGKELSRSGLQVCDGEAIRRPGLEVVVR